MRASEFITEEAKAAKYNGLLLKFAFNDGALIMKAFDPATKNPVSYVKFVKENEELYPQDLWVNDDYRNKGIAKSMYDYLKSEGYVINRSHDQTNAGSGFWDKHRGEDAYVWEGINPDILDKRFKHTQVIGNYTYTASVEIFMDDPLLNITAYDGNKEIGSAMFQIFDWEDDPNEGYMESGGTSVDTKYRNKGVASTMYAYAKMLGNDIRPSDNRTEQGKAMWSAWQRAGDAEHLAK